MIAKKDRRYVVSVRHQKELINRTVNEEVEEASAEKEELLTDPEEVFAKIDQKGEEDEDDFVPSEVPEPLTEYKDEVDDIFKRIDYSEWPIRSIAWLIEDSVVHMREQFESRYNRPIDISIGGALYAIKKKRRIILSFYLRDENGKILAVIIKSIKLKEKIRDHTMKLESDIGFKLGDTVGYLTGSYLSTTESVSLVDIANVRYFGQLLYESGYRIERRVFYPSQVDSYGFVDDLSLSIGTILCELTEGVD